MRTLLRLGRALLVSFALFLPCSLQQNTTCDQRPIGPPLISGATFGDKFGERLAISGDGSVVAIVASSFKGATGSDTGLVQVYQRNNTNNEWSEIGRFEGSECHLNDDGTILAIGEPKARNNAGEAQVHEYINSKWNPRGGKLFVESTPGGSYGFSLALSADGATLIVGASDFGAGSVYVYQWNSDGNSWDPKGRELTGERTGGVRTGNRFGSKVAISKSGNVIGATARNSGAFARIFEFQNSDWIQLGEDIAIEADEKGEAEQGAPLSLSSNGRTFAVGEHVHANERGRVRVYEFVERRWKEKGERLIGDQSLNHFGLSVSLSGDALFLAIGSPGLGVFNRGAMRLYRYQTPNWRLIFEDIGNRDDESFGRSVDISRDGSTLVVGANSEGRSADNQPGYAQVYSVNQTCDGTLVPPSSIEATPAPVSAPPPVSHLEEKSSTLPLGVIVSIPCAVLIVVGTVLAAIVYKRKKSDRNTQSTAVPCSDSAVVAPAIVLGPVSQVGSQDIIANERFHRNEPPPRDVVHEHVASRHLPMGVDRAGPVRAELLQFKDQCRPVAKSGKK